MGRFLNSDISYPFVGASTYPELRFLKDLVIQVDGPADSTTSSSGLSGESLVCLEQIQGSVITLKAYRKKTDSLWDVWDMSFAVPSGEGFCTVRFGTCAALLDISEFPDSGMQKTYARGELAVEPCLCRWLQGALAQVELANEERVMNPQDRTHLSTTVCATLTPSSGIDLSDGYNTTLLLNSEGLRFYASPGSGLGLAPDNMWDVGTRPDNSQVLKSVNGVGADGDGNLLLTASPSLTLGLDGPSKLKIMDNNI